MTNAQIYVPRRISSSAWHDIRGVRYHVREWGDRDRPVLFLLHGWGDCSASFQFLVDALEADWFVVAPDWRGFGLTHQRAQAYWFPDYLADLDRLLTAYQSATPVNLLGHSMGGNVAALYAGIFPERVRCFVNVEGFGLAESEPGRAPTNYRRWVESMREVPAYASYASYAELAERIAKRNRGMGRDKALFVAQAWALQREDGRVELRADPAHKLPNAVQYRRAEAEACWDRITAPVLLVFGEDSEFAGAAQGWRDAEASRRAFRGAKTASIPGTGHMVHFERPAELAAVTKSFIDAAGGAVVQD